jgi:hypothetical protein
MQARALAWFGQARPGAIHWDRAKHSAQDWGLSSSNQLTKKDQPVAANEVEPAAAGLRGKEESKLGEGWAVEVLDLHSMTPARPQHECSAAIPSMNMAAGHVLDCCWQAAALPHVFFVSHSF